VNQASLNVDQLLSALQRKGIPLPFEIGTFLVLQAAEQALVLEATEQGMAAPPAVAMGDVWLSDDGEVSLEPSRSAGDEQEACRALVELLGDLLVRSAPGVSPMLLELVEHGPSDGEWTLMRLRDDLEAALVPLNRGALRRVLARLLREVRRDAERAPAGPLPDARAVDRDVDALFGVQSASAADEAGPSAPPSRAAQGLREHDGGEQSGDDESSEQDEAPTQRRTRDEALGPAASRAKRSGPRLFAGGASRPSLINDEEPAPRRRRGPSSDAPGGFDDEASGRSGTRFGLGLLLLAVVLVVGYLSLGRERVRALLGLAPAAESAPAAEARAPDPRAKQPETPKYGQLRVTSSPERAQVLLFVGTGPVVVPDLPTGVAHEFVALAPGKAPSRAVVPADAAFQPDGARRRYELALQLDDLDARRSVSDLGATRLPQQVGTPNGGLGDVRVITSPPGARVYQLIGFTPDVAVENLKVAEPLEVLVYLSGHELARIAVSERDFRTADGRLVAALDVPLRRASK
jgi:hypothetical protein